MNQRNVDALREALRSFYDGSGVGSPEEEAWLAGMSRHLASHGLLVPSALTDDDLHLVYDYLEGIKRMPDEGDDERELLSSSRGAVRALERIAKGEA